MFTTDKLKCALNLEEGFKENPKLEESWIGLMKVDNELLVIVKERESNGIESQQVRGISKIKKEFKKGIF